MVYWKGIPAEHVGIRHSFGYAVCAGFYIFHVVSCEDVFSKKL